MSYSLNKKQVEFIKRVAKNAENLAAIIDSVAHSAADFLEGFSSEVYREAMKEDDRLRAEAMANHPAGKGRDNKTDEPSEATTALGDAPTSEPTRDEMIKFVQGWLSFKNSVWHTDPDSINDATVKSSYQYAKKHPKQYGPGNPSN